MPWALVFHYKKMYFIYFELNFNIKSLSIYCDAKENKGNQDQFICKQHSLDWANSVYFVTSTD